MNKIKWFAAGVAAPFVAFVLYAIGYLYFVPYEQW